LSVNGSQSGLVAVMFVVRQTPPFTVPMYTICDSFIGLVAGSSFERRWRARRRLTGSMDCTRFSTKPLMIGAGPSDDQVRPQR